MICIEKESTETLTNYSTSTVVNLYLQNKFDVVVVVFKVISIKKKKILENHHL